MSLTPSVYRGVPVLSYQPDWSNPSQVMTFTQIRNKLGNDMSPGPLAFDAPHMPRPRTSFRLRFVLETRDEMNAARDFLLTTAQGRRRPFWVPLWSQAMHLDADIEPTDTEILITRSYFSSLVFGVGLGREHLAFFPQVPNACPELVPRRILDAIEGDTNETVTIWSGIGSAMTSDDLICFLLYCRLDTDAPVLQWESFETGILEIPVIDLPAQSPIEDEAIRMQLHLATAAAGAMEFSGTVAT